MTAASPQEERGPREAWDWPGQELSAAAKAGIRTCRTCAGQGDVKALAQMRRTMLTARAAGETWPSLVPLNDAVKAGTLSCLRTLVDELNVSTINARVDSYTPLQLAVIWGKVDVLVFLLARDADPMLETSRSVVDMARLRQQRLQEALDRSGDGAEFEGFSITKTRIQPLIEEGKELLHILEGVEGYGCYADWAEHNAHHPLVRRFTEGLCSSEPRYQLALLRHLLFSERAALRPAEERAAQAAEEAAKAAAKAKEEQALTDVLCDAGFSMDTAKELRDTFRAANLKTLRSLKLSADEIEAKLESSVRQRRMTEGEKRRFTRFVREMDDPPPQAKPAAAKASAGTAKPKAKASAALLAMAAKGSGKGGPAAAAKAAPAKSKKVVLDPFALLFREDLPDMAFAVVVRFLFGV